MISQFFARLWCRAFGHAWLGAPLLSILSNCDLCARCGALERRKCQCGHPSPCVGGCR